MRKAKNKKPEKKSRVKPQTGNGTLRSKASNLIVQSSPKYIAITYFLMIPLFAIIFSLMPSHFYHTTNKYEHYWKEEIEELGNSIFKEIRREFISVHKKPEIKIIDENLKFNIDSSHVYDLKINEETISFKLFTRINHKKIWFPIFNNWDLEMEISSLISTKTEFTKAVNIIDEGIEGMNDTLKLFPSFEAEFVQCSTCKFPFIKAKYSIKLSNYTENKLQAVVKANKGFPSSTAGNFVRMMYLSATTLTTLGLGDIQPVSNWARTLITLETVIGIVLMGLFLNSLAQNIKSGS